ncbi:hypothetical protein MA16_Dca002993 [Dendrobium catenatum]|uniref:Uncharacterized protein n=1 Tax=Dendrobium catenatum TaxID=906689 RepID=A0A2I0X9C0_9ASPA|nr:hypothetical protein MA16_Dca002993 [Dendrobium catenatum]
MISSSSKRGRLAAESSSSSSRHSARFLSVENEEAYHKYKACKITPSKMLNQAALNFKVEKVKPYEECKNSNFRDECRNVRRENAHSRSFALEMEHWNLKIKKKPLKMWN